MILILVILYIIPLISLLAIAKLMFTENTAKELKHKAKLLIVLSIIPFFNIAALIIILIFVFSDVFAEKVLSRMVSQ